MTRDGRFDLRLGIDVGGTNTDAVVLDRDDRLVAKAKRPTTADVSGGMRAAIDAVLSHDAVDKRRVTHVMLGTTHATNAVLERRNLNRVAVVRIGSPAADSVRPLFGWPEDLRRAVSAGEIMVRGGLEFDGRDIVPFDADALARFLEPLAGAVGGVAITGVFASVSARQEQQAQEIVRKLMGDDVHVSMSHEIGSLGLLVRENATVLNSALVSAASEVAGTLQAALAAYDIRPVTFFAQNDGTLMALEYALRYPVLTIGSGPANSMRGAAYLTGASDAIVADVGGTSTDFGVLVNGFPRESSAAVEIGGIHTNFRMPDIVAIPLGGGSIVANGDGAVRIGPTSVGYRLSEEALVFGGSTPTLTDAAVAGGRTQIGSGAPGREHAAMLEQALAIADGMLADAVDRVKTVRGDRPLIVVGGGSGIVPEHTAGVSEVIRPDHYDVANAIGAAIAAVSGQVDQIFHLGAGGRRAILAEAEAYARDQAVAAGADPAHVEIVELEESPLAYLTNPAVRVRVKAAGPLSRL